MQIQLLPVFVKRFCHNAVVAIPPEPGVWLVLLGNGLKSVLPCRFDILEFFFELAHTS